ncbi:pre-mRNA-splicing factor 8 homolog [Striga asiatica]|uniref:Pre-mRNA-splicing factor 8 homolog n=1 Tax=Striga asiatica TaxID=4170 RepID=A0A5A7QF84_STRAF|nr:pre-mRNA-splicing factor 8 homolog [Striga asiatica]
MSGNGDGAWNLACELSVRVFYYIALLPTCMTSIFISNYDYATVNSKFAESISTVQTRNPVVLFQMAPGLVRNPKARIIPNNSRQILMEHITRGLTRNKTRQSEKTEMASNKVKKGLPITDGSSIKSKTVNPTFEGNMPTNQPPQTHQKENTLMPEVQTPQTQHKESTLLQEVQTPQTQQQE